MGLPLAYLLDLKGYDPLAAAKRLKLPMLFLQGERDFQVTMKISSIWKSAMAGRSDATFHAYPALNHLFIAGEGEARSGRIPRSRQRQSASWLAISPIGSRAT